MNRKSQEQDDPSRPLRIANIDIAPGTRQTVNLPVPPLYTHADMSIPVHVIRGRRPGPRLFVCAAIHGDEINGVEIIRRLLATANLERLKGALLAVPVVNVYGFTSRTRYLPDRRDLNRFFPGSRKGSMASRLAHTFFEEIVENCTHGIDLHTGAVHRTNLPQVRVCFDDDQALRLAHAFRVPVIMNANLRDGSLRQAVLEHNIPVLLYEGGEALRFDEQTIRVGVRGILSVMRDLGMLPKRPLPRNAISPMLANDSRWVRAPESGTLTLLGELGDEVVVGDRLGTLASPLGENEVTIRSPVSGVVIGRTMLPLVYEGEAIVNIAHVDAAEDVDAKLDQFEENLSLDNEGSR